MPSYRDRSRSRSASPQSRSQRRRDGADDAGPSRRDSHRQKDERSDRRRRDDYSDEEDSKRRRRRYDDDDDKREKRHDSRQRSRSPSRDRATSRDHDKRRHDDEPKDRDRDRNGSEQRNSGRSTQALPSQNSAMAAAGVPSSKKFGKQGAQSRSPSPSAEAIAASKPNFSNSGALAAETNTFKGVVLKYNEPPEARKPAKGWRLYVFKGKEQVDMVQVNRQSAYLFGRDKVVVDIPIEHPSASKQHAVLQYRQVHERNEFGDAKSVTKPYIIDLDSANGTTVNEEKVPPSRYYELQSNDLIKFAYSTREYVLLAE